VELSTEQIYELAPYARTLGVEFTDIDKSLVRARLRNIVELSTLGGSMHGGALMSLCDLSAAVCAGLNIDQGCSMTTAESTTYFLNPLRGSVALASARPIKVGRSLIYIEIDVHDEEGKHCVRTCQAVAVRRPT
jgi:1,4-dihydroxy-2-naphthoyl-CoA hydrolase